MIGRARAAGAQYSRRDLPFEPGPGTATRFVNVTVTPYDAPDSPAEHWSRSPT